MIKERLSSLGFFRIAVVSPQLQVADVDYNRQKICAAMDECSAQGVQLVVFPELCITGYTCGDLFYQQVLLDYACEAVFKLASYSAHRKLAIVVGAPCLLFGKLFNCAIFISHGNVLGIIPKSYLPNTHEFYEQRWFASEYDRTSTEVFWHKQRIPFGKDLLFQSESYLDCIVGVELCEDLWVPQPPSSEMALQGATVLVNPSSSNALIGKLEYRRLLIQSQSGRCLAAYAYAAAGPGESTTDLVFAGHSVIAENGVILAETSRFEFETQIAIADIDVQRLLAERIQSRTFAQSPAPNSLRLIPFTTIEINTDKLYRSTPTYPFVPIQEERLQKYQEIFAIQTTALAKRMLATSCKAAVIGVSGGVDSTLALLVTIKAFQKINLDIKNIYAVTMPGLGTTNRTKSNAESLAELLGVTLKVIPIHKAIEQHFLDIEHDPNVHDITYENAQARERTQILMDLANKLKAIVIGTGDLSELALGWCTYSGDHISMYAVNSGVPKTLVSSLIEWSSQHEFTGQISAILQDICQTPASPELLPIDKEGESQQITENSIGPYILHDYFLYYTLRFQYSPRKIAILACHTFADMYQPQEILQWMKVFYQRFFSQQFKRSCLPDGPKVGTVALSPRGDWRMPSDAVANVWLQDLQKIEQELLKK